MATRVRDKHQEWLKNPAYAQAFSELEQEFSIADTLIQARAEAGLTQGEVAERMGVSQPTIARIEAGRNVSLKTLGRYAAALGHSIRFEVVPMHG